MDDPQLLRNPVMLRPTSFLLLVCLMAWALINQPTSFAQSSSTAPTRQFPRSYTGPAQVSTVDELRNWAESGFGGGRVDELDLLGHTPYIADRSWTSGVYSSEVGIYVRSGEGLVLRYSIPLQHMHYHKFLVKNDRLVIFRGDQSQQKEIIVKLPASEHFDS
jgi:hypothetical protein